MLKMNTEELTSNPILNKCILSDFDVYECIYFLLDSNLTDSQISDYDRSLFWSYYDQHLIIEKIEYAQYKQQFIEKELFVREICDM